MKRLFNFLSSVIILAKYPSFHFSYNRISGCSFGASADKHIDHRQKAEE